MTDLERGARVRISDPRSAYYRRVGVIEKSGAIGGFWIRHDDGQLIYHAWGYEMVSDEEDQENEMDHV